MKLEHDICYQALKTRDSRFDGRFFTGVQTTGIFCRPICPATTPKESNCTFYGSAAAAMEAGFRPCLRCRPESAPNSPPWMGTEAVVRRGLRLIEEGALDHGQSVEDLASRLGIGERHLRRLFQTHIGASPQQVAQTRRLMFAKKLLRETSFSITDISEASGFSSLRRFNDAYLKAFQINPSAERKSKKKSKQIGTQTLYFTYRPPFDWQGLLDYFAFRAIDGIEEVVEDCYIRLFKIDDQTCQFQATNEDTKNRLKVTLNNVPISHLRDISQKIRRLFDLDCDPEAIATDLSKDPALKNIITDYAGLRLPGAWDGFEIALRAVIGQQISVKAARTITKRVIDRIGTGFFPSPDEILNTSLDGLGLTQRRIDTLKKLAALWQEPDRALSGEENVKRLCELPGIGPWTASYMTMRILSEPDIYPVDDLGLLRGLENLGQPCSKKDLKERAENWRPWRAYGALYLWKKHDL